MSNYDNTNTGVLFKNDRKEKDTQPDYTGSFNKDGTEHFLSAWLNKDKNGKTYMSVKLGEVKTGGQQSKPAQQAPQSESNDFDDSSIPF